MKTRKLLPARRHTGGFTLIELLVAVAIGMALVLAITLMMVRYEGGRRTLTSLNDSSIGGAYVSYSVDRLVRSAGSGYAQAWRNAYGCQLVAARGGTTTLPRPAPFPAPFASVPQAVRLAPVIVHAGAGTDGSDILAIHTGSSGLGESPLRLMTASATGTGVRVPSTLGIRGGDLVMVYQDASNCMLQQVTTGFAGGADQALNFGGTYAASDIGGVRLEDMGRTDNAWVSVLGNTTGNRPLFQLLGVGPNATLMSLDVLQIGGGDDLVAIADGVADLRALYGVDTNDDGRVDSWQNPATAGSPWRAAALLDGSAASRTNLSRIVALRVGVIIRTSLPEREDVAADTITLFGDLGVGLTQTRTLTAAEKRLRWRSLDFTIPLRNVLLAPRP